MTSCLRTCQSISEELQQRFQRLHAAPPKWAWPFAPSCPLVGERYASGDGLLVYASAENFSWMSRLAAPARFKDERVWSRYRACYEEHGRNSDKFFPDVGIQPVTDGGLFAAALYVANVLSLPRSDSPREFLETAAFTNWCKFTIKPGSNGRAVNEDYAGVEGKMGESLSYVITELAILQPKVVLIPRPIWQRPLLQAAMRGAAPFTRFLPVTQFNATVVNCHLAGFTAPAQRLRRKLSRTPLTEWMQNLYGFHRENAWRYLAFLDATINSNQ